MTKKIKKPMSILLSLIMVVSMFVAFSVTAQAGQEIEIIIVTPTHDGDFIKTEENTTLGTSVIGAPSSNSSNTTWTGNYVYYGVYSGSVKYRVLAPYTTAYTESGKATMLLDCDGTYGPNIRFGSSNAWANSTLKKYMNNPGQNQYVLGGCTEVEKSSVVGSVKATGSVFNDNGTSVAYVPLTGEKAFALSIDEIHNSTYGYVSDGTRNKNLSSSQYGYWLRSAKGTGVYTISRTGKLSSDSANNNSSYWESPALNIDLNAVMFSSLLSGSGTGYGNEYKLTLKDTSLTVAQNGTILKAGDNLIVPYTASSGANNVSVLITDKAWTESDAKILQYGPLNGTKNGSTFNAEGTGTFEFNPGLQGSYHIYLLAEKDNSVISTASNGKYSKHRKTDYAGTPVEVNQSQIREITHHDAVKPTCYTDGNVEYWQDDSTGKVYVFSEDGITLTDYVLPAGHVWDTKNITWVWNDTVIPPTASAHVVCTRDNSHTDDIEATVTFVETLSEPTCTETGESKYKATVTVYGEEYTNERVVTVPANGHTPSEAVKETIAPTYDEEGHVDSVVYCSVCGAELSREVLSTIDKLPKTDLSAGHLIANPLVFAYDEEAHTASAVLKYNGTRLVEGVDYVLTGNTATEPGTYTLEAQGIGAYKGTVYATWRICNVYFVTATIDGVTTTTSYEDKSLVKFTSSGNGAWYINDVLTSTKNELSFTILRDSVVEWRADETQEQIAIANSAISARTKNGDKDRVTITATWSLPEGTVVTQAGTARCYTTDTTPNKETVYNTGTKKNSTLKTLNGTFEFNLNMGATSAAKTLCVVTYVTYTLNGQEYTVISEVATSAPQNA